MSAPIAFFEITGPDSQALTRFYADTFGWTIESEPFPGYTYLKAGDLLGGIREEKEGPVERVIYVRVPDVEATLAQVAAAGGRTIVPPMRLPSGQTFAVFLDPVGNKTGLLQA